MFKVHFFDWKQKWIVMEISVIDTVDKIMITVLLYRDSTISVRRYITSV